MIYLLTKRILKLTNAWKAGSHSEDRGDQGTKRKHTLSAYCCCSITNSYPDSFVTPWSLPGSSVHGISQARIFEWVNISSFRGIFPNQGLNLSLLFRQADSLSLSHQGSPASFKIKLKRFWWIRLQEHQACLPSLGLCGMIIELPESGGVIIRVRINVITSF